MVRRMVVRGVPTRPDVRGRRSSGCTTGSVPSPCGAVWPGEGRLDVDFLMLMGVSPAVREYRPQPGALALRSGGFYHPDGLVLGVGLKLYVEVKPKAMLARSPDLGGRLDDIRAACAAEDAGFAILTEVEIRAEPLWSNVKRVWSAAHGLDPAEVVEATRTLRTGVPATLGAVADLIGPDGWRVALGLVGLKLLAVDLNGPLGPGSPVRAGARFA